VDTSDISGDEQEEVHEMQTKRKRKATKRFSLSCEPSEFENTNTLPKKMLPNPPEVGYTLQLLDQSADIHDYPSNQSQASLILSGAPLRSGDAKGLRSETGKFNCLF